MNRPPGLVPPVRGCGLKNPSNYQATRQFRKISVIWPETRLSWGCKAPMNHT